MTRYESTPFRLVSRRFILCKVELLGWKSKLKSGSQVGSFRISAQKGSERERERLSMELSKGVQIG